MVSAFPNVHLYQLQLSNITSWYEPPTRKELEEDVKAMIEFCKLVSADHKALSNALVKNKQGQPSPLQLDPKFVISILRT